MAAFDYSDPKTGMSSTGLNGTQSSFDSSGMNYDSGLGTSAPKLTTEVQPNKTSDIGNTAQPTQPTPTDGTLLGTVAPKMTFGGPGPSPMNIDPRFTGMDPRLMEVYQRAGFTPSNDRGSGFADWQYWQNDAVRNAGGDWNYVLGRLGSDLAGTGTDQPTGTPGQGIWNNSGRNQVGGNQNTDFLQQLFSSLFGGNNTPQQPQRQYAQPLQNQTVNPNQSGMFQQLMQKIFGNMSSGIGGQSQSGMADQQLSGIDSFLGLNPKNLTDYSDPNMIRIPPKGHPQ